MHFRCQKRDLVEGISTVQKAILGKSPMAVLEGIYIETGDQEIIMRGSDIDLSIETLVASSIMEEGRIVIDSKLFGDIIRKLPDAMIELATMENNTILISCENSEFNLLYLNAEEFPMLPEIGNREKIAIKEDTFRNLIRSTSFAVAQDESRPILMGVLFEVKNKVLNMVALDGFRLAMRSEYLESNEDVSVVIPGKTLNEVSKILSDKDEDLFISFNDNHILFEIQNTKIVSRLLSGNFIKYESIIPTDYKLQFKVKRAHLTHSIERASLMAKDGSSRLIKLNIENDRALITSNSQFGKVKEEVPVSMDGDAIEIAFNANYLLDTLKVMDEEEIIIEMTSGVSPAIIRNSITDNCKYMVLPVRLAR
ncbi:MAG: DNA polymerase III subunit beta [Clostridia bacterium]|nr:DNA polymerase III subunit beta [Clostridia bacterium]